MKKIAIPLENGCFCLHLGHCQQIVIVEVEENAIVRETYLTPPPHESGLLPDWVAERGVTDVIAGGMGQYAFDMFALQKINVHITAENKSHRELVAHWLKNTLVKGVNACDH